MKYLGITLIWNLQNLCKENIKTVLKNTKVDLSIGKDTLALWQEESTLKTELLPRLIYKVNVIQIKIRTY